ncbi:MAG: GWxTD domain-containing protein [Acidobacteriota bacterium]|nr:GWxTD domain-containing protein [Acidobacteriota bacterium]
MIFSYSKSRSATSLLLVLTLTLAVVWAGPKEKDASSEEAVDYYNKWLNDTVVHIIAHDERAVFEKLTSPEEKENFIEQFWRRRDPDPRTMINEFKEEHYRRIAYADDHFSSGLAGRNTDRGRIYIMHGPPAEIESFPAGGRYDRTLEEGLGTTIVFPFERWRYRNLEGIGSNIIIEFVDQSMTGDYKLAYHPDEKDLMDDKGFGGMKWAEVQGWTDRSERWLRHGYPMMDTSGAGDWLQVQKYFDRLRVTTATMGQTKGKYDDLKKFVRTRVSYEPLPFRLRNDQLELNGEEVLVLLTLEVPKKELNFKPGGADTATATLDLYGVVTNMTNQHVAEIDQEIAVHVATDELAGGLNDLSLHQVVLALDRGQRCKLELFLQDLESGKVGSKTLAINPFRPRDEGLGASTLLLSDHVRQLGYVPEQYEMFVMGDLVIRPSVSRSFDGENPLWVYLEIYGLELDSASSKPSIKADYFILKDGQIVFEIHDSLGKSVYFSSNRRTMLLQRFPLDRLQPGKYTLSAQIADRIGGNSTSREEKFTILKPAVDAGQAQVLKR